MSSATVLALGLLVQAASPSTTATAATATSGWRVAHDRQRLTARRSVDLDRRSTSAPFVGGADVRRCRCTVRPPTCSSMLASMDLPPIEEQTPDDVRAQRAAMLRPSPEPIAETRDLDAGGVPARFYRPAATRSAGLLVWFHGGGWVLGDLDSHDDACRSLANRGGFCVLSVGYRLAPSTRSRPPSTTPSPPPAWAVDARRRARLRRRRRRRRLGRRQPGRRRRQPAAGADLLPAARLPGDRRPHGPPVGRRRTARATSSPRPASAGSSATTSPATRPRRRIPGCRRCWRTRPG